MRAFALSYFIFFCCVWSFLGGLLVSEGKWRESGSEEAKRLGQWSEGVEIGKTVVKVHYMKEESIFNF